MEDLSNLSKMTFYEFKLDEAKELYREAVIDEDEHQVIVNGWKLRECHAICMTLTEKRAKIPIKIQAQANYYLSIGRSDDVALEYLTQAIDHCISFELKTGESVQGLEIIRDARWKLQVAVDVEQSDYGGVAVGCVERGRNGGLLQTRGLPTMTITAPSPTSGPRRKLPIVKAKHIKQESLSDEDKLTVVPLGDYPLGTRS